MNSSMITTNTISDSKLKTNKYINGFMNSATNRIANMFGIIPSALVVTLCLLYGMYLLVHKDYPVIVPKTLPVIPEVFMMDTTIDPILEEQPPVRPVEQAAPPPIHNVDPVETEIVGDFNFNERIVTVKPPFKGGLGLGGQMVPFIKIAPQYPATAATRGIEGHVDVMFDVTELGSTDNIRIIGYVPSAVFNKSVIKAVKGWKYKPNEVDGVAVRTFDIKDRIRFTMEK
jgi:protein TonB